MSDKQESITVSFEVTIDVEGKDAILSIPEELRITERLLQYLTEALAQRGLTLKHLNVGPSHVSELEKIKNVQFQPGSGIGRDGA